MCFPFYKTEAGIATQQVGLHGVLSSFSSFFPPALTTAIVWEQHLVMPSAPACDTAPGDQPLTQAGPAIHSSLLGAGSGHPICWTGTTVKHMELTVPQVLRSDSVAQSSPPCCPQVRFLSASWWFWWRWSRNYILRNPVYKSPYCHQEKKKSVCLFKSTFRYHLHQNAPISRVPSEKWLLV